MKNILYEENFKHNDLKKNVVEDLILKYVKKEPILDVGCGNGNLLNVLRKFDSEGIDPSELAIQRARELNLKVYLEDIGSFQPTRKYKTIMLIGVLAELSQPQEDFKKVLSWLTKDGEVIIVHPNSSSPFFKEHKSHRWLLTYYEFKNFLKSNKLKIKVCKGAGRLKDFPFLSSVNFYIAKKEIVKNENT